MSNFTWNIQRLWVDGPCGFVAQLWLFSYATFVIRFKSIRLILFDSINTGLICFSVRRFSPVNSLVAFKKFLGVIDVGPIPIVVFFLSVFLFFFQRSLRCLSFCYYNQIRWIRLEFITVTCLLLSLETQFPIEMSTRLWASGADPRGKSLTFESPPRQIFFLLLINSFFKLVWIIMIQFIKWFWFENFLIDIMVALKQISLGSIRVWV